MRTDKTTHRFGLKARIFNTGIPLLILVVSPVKPILADQGTGPGISVSGHFDVRAVGRNAAVRDNDFQVGQAVIDLASRLTERIDANMEIAYNLDEEIDIGQAYVDWNLFRWNGRPRTNTIGVVDVGFRAGQFNVPFGLDWRVYSSAERKLVTVPMVVANTHRGWNDVGVMFHGTTTWSNWAIFAVNGFDTSPALRLPTTPITSPLASEEETAAGFAPVALAEAYGARGGIVINDNFEVGTSFGAGYTEDNEQDERLWAFDLTGRFENLELKTEFISHERGRTTHMEKVQGYYLQGSYSVGSLYGVVRHDVFNPDGTLIYPFETTAYSTLFCTSLGGGYRFGARAQVRLEYQLAEGSSNDTVYLQTAVVF